MRIFPLPAPETPAELAIAERGLRRRIAPALFATAVMLSLLLGLVFVPALRELPAAFGIHDGIARGIALELPIAAAVMLLSHGLVGLTNVGLTMRGAGTSLALSVPVLLLSLADAKPMASPAAAMLAAICLLALLVAVVEEVYGRGLLVALLGGRQHALFAIVGSSVLFAYLHMPIYVHRFGLEDALLRCTGSAAFSVVFAIIRLRSGSLVGPIVFHAINDAQFLLPVAGGSGPATPATAQPILIGAAIAVVYWLGCRRAIVSDARGAGRGAADNR